jgi:hypothetical protein
VAIVAEIALDDAILIHGAQANVDDIRSLIGEARNELGARRGRIRFSPFSRAVPAKYRPLTAL